MQTQHYLGQRKAGEPVSRQDELAWAHFYDYTSRQIRRYAHRCGLSEADMVDCVQEVWHELLKRLPHFELDSRRGQFDTWLFSIVRGKVINQFRAHQRHGSQRRVQALLDFPDARPQASRTLEQEELLVLAWQQLKRRLSACNYQILHLRLVEQRSVPEVALAMGLSPARVWYRSHRARLVLEEICRSLAQEQTRESASKDCRENRYGDAQGEPAAAVSQDASPGSLWCKGGSSVDFVFKKLELGRRTVAPEWKVEWQCSTSPTPILSLRKLAIVAYAEICGPEDIVNNHWPRIAHAAVTAGVAAGIATIIATPTAALPIFRAEFKKHLQCKAGSDFGDEVHVALSASQEPNGPWCTCNE
jgi:RNA polymerase sigma factor (sigma-70 family)